jgi:CrcB protein
MMFQVLMVAAGGALGAAARFLAGAALTRLAGPGFPWGTLAVNLAGCFAMGVLVVALAQAGAMRHAPLLLTGLLGGFTTFSAFSLDAVALYERGEAGLALAYVGGSVGGSLAALALGLAAARRLWA